MLRLDLVTCPSLKFFAFWTTFYPNDLVDINSLGLAFDGNRICQLAIELVLDLLVGALADENGPRVGFGEVLQAGGEIGIIADNGVVDALRRAKQPYKDFA